MVGLLVVLLLLLLLLWLQRQRRLLSTLCMQAIKQQGLLLCLLCQLPCHLSKLLQNSIRGGGGNQLQQLPRLLLSNDGTLLLGSILQGAVLPLQLLLLLLLCTCEKRCEVRATRCECGSCFCAECAAAECFATGSAESNLIWHVHCHGHLHIGSHTTC
jgi:hypothetical protein